MLSKGVLGLALSMLWASVAVIAYGTHLKSVAPQYPACWNKTATEMIADSTPGHDAGPSIGVGLALDAAWPFTAGCSGLVAGVATVGLLAGRRAVGQSRTVRLLSAVLLTFWCLACAAAFVQSATGDFRWRFEVLGAGEVMAAMGLALTAMAGWLPTESLAVTRPSA